MPHSVIHIHMNSSHEISAESRLQKLKRLVHEVVSKDPKFPEDSKDIWESMHLWERELLRAREIIAIALSTGVAAWVVDKFEASLDKRDQQIRAAVERYRNKPSKQTTQIVQNTIEQNLKWMFGKLSNLEKESEIAHNKVRTRLDQARIHALEELHLQVKCMNCGAEHPRFPYISTSCHMCGAPLATVPLASPEKRLLRKLYKEILVDIDKTYSRAYHSQATPLEAKELEKKVSSLIKTLKARVRAVEKIAGDRKRRKDATERKRIREEMRKRQQQQPPPPPAQEDTEGREVPPPPPQEGKSRKKRDLRKLRNMGFAIAAIMAVTSAFYIFAPELKKISRKTIIRFQLFLSRLRTRYNWIPGKSLPPQAQAELLAVLESLNTREQARLSKLVERIKHRMGAKIKIRKRASTADEILIGQVLLGLDSLIMAELNPVSLTDGYTYTYIFPTGHITVANATELDGVVTCAVSYHSVVANTSYSHILEATSMEDFGLERVIVEARHRIPSELLEEYTNLVCAVQDSEGPDKLYAGRRLRQFQSAYKHGSYDEAITLSGTING